jgi:hypothetical protein
MRDPATPAEWQDAVDGARFFLLLDSARQYGLVAGGPGVDSNRCIDILKQGAALGVKPAPDAELVDRALSVEVVDVDVKADGG